jgi:hypothetical protein
VPGTIPRVGERPLRVTGAEPVPGPTPAGPASPPSRVSRLLVGLAAALAIFGGYLAWRTAELERANEALAGELAATRALVEAHRAQLAGARERAGSLRGQVEELETFLAQDPAAAAASE